MLDRGKWKPGVEDNWRANIQGEVDGTEGVTKSLYGFVGGRGVRKRKGQGRRIW